jgi:hypothetical protein
MEPSAGQVAEFAELSDMKFPVVLYLLSIYWCYTEDTLSKL